MPKSDMFFRQKTHSGNDCRPPDGILSAAFAGLNLPSAIWRHRMKRKPTRSADFGSCQNIKNVDKSYLYILIAGFSQSEEKQ
jgi:hypothetical protein